MASRTLLICVVLFTFYSCLFFEEEPDLQKIEDNYWIMKNPETPELGYSVVKKKNKGSNYSTYIASNCSEVILIDNTILIRYWKNEDATIEGYLKTDTRTGHIKKISASNFIDKTTECSYCRRLIP
ncbi:hypothetical protein AB9P05_11425 [Roseivirga sp. BDSF3-8]|uniref:hypothetical protein n=1 Tax=Roseivirga sp. BDSF3-8 TaxID=3241598 RepID=UPI003531BD70